MFNEMVIKIIGTGHILSRSIGDVRKAIYGERPDFVAVELDLKRFKTLEDFKWDPASYQSRVSFRDLFASLMGGGSFPVFLEGLLALIQGGVGERYGIYPGADMCSAIVSAKNSGAKIVLIDRDIETTMNHFMRIPLREFIHLFLSRGDNLGVVFKLLNGNIEEILKKENLDIIMDKLKNGFPGTYGALIEERDQYMAYILYIMEKEHPDANILAVVGAGHKDGILEYLNRINNDFRIDMQKILEIRPISSIRAFFLVFVVFIVFILIELSEWR